jgi:hypothetical protein
MRLVQIFGVVLVLTAGCSGGGSRTASVFGGATEPPAVSSAAEEDENPAPEVPDPLEVDGIVDDPCAALGREQFGDLGIEGPGERRESRAEPACDWRMTSSRLHSITITARTEDRGLRSVYGRQDSQQYFEPTEVDGYPAVFASPLDQRGNGNCTLHVGLTDDLTATVETHFLDQDPCPVTEDAAAAMLDHVREGT